MKKSEKLAICIPIISFAVVVGIIMGCNAYRAKQRREELERRKAEDPVINAIQEGLGEDVALYTFDSDYGYYKYLLNTYEKNVIAQLEATLNNMQNKSQNKICVVIYDSFHNGKQPVLLLQNYSWQEKMTKDGKFTYLEICDPPCRGSNTDFFLDLDIYTTLSDIRYLRIEYPMQKLAEEAGIDWYEVWPELESAESYTRGDRGEEIYTDILRRD